MTKDIVDNWLNKTKGELITNYDRLGLRASGNWANTINPESKVTDTSIQAIMYGEKYTGAIEFGRRPNTNQDPDYLRRWAYGFGTNVIKRWCQDKGIDVKYAVPIAYKIAKKGWKVPNAFNAGGLVSDVFNDTSIKVLLKDLTLWYVKEIKTDMVNTLANGNN